MYLEAFQVNGNNALVTASRRSLGAVIVVGLAEAGVSVGCRGHDPDPGATCDAISAAGRKTFSYSGDLANATAYGDSSKKRLQSLARSTSWRITPERSTERGV
jgi:hypothetical protein